MTNTKDLTIMFFDTERGWVTDTLTVDEREEATVQNDETVEGRPAYYI